MKVLLMDAGSNHNKAKTFIFTKECFTTGMN